MLIIAALFVQLDISLLVALSIVGKISWVIQWSKNQENILFLKLPCSPLQGVRKRLQGQQLQPQPEIPVNKQRGPRRARGRGDPKLHAQCPSQCLFHPCPQLCSFFLQKYRFPGGPVVETLPFQRSGYGTQPRLGLGLLSPATLLYVNLRSSTWAINR